MNTFTITCVGLVDLCSELGINAGEALHTLSESDICFGTNDHTLASVARVCRILEIDVPAVLDSQLMVCLDT
jgi:hypothetical protein